MKEIISKLTDNLAKKLIVYFSLICFLAIVIISIIVGNSVDVMQKKNFVEFNMNSIKLVNQSLSVYIDGVSHQVNLFGNDGYFITLLSNGIDYTVKQDYIDEKIKSMFASNSSIEKISLYLPFCNSYDIRTNRLYNNNLLYIISKKCPTLRLFVQNEIIQNELIYDFSIFSGEKISSILSNPKILQGDSTQDTFINYSMAIYDPFNKKKVGMISVNLNRISIMNIVEKVKVFPNESVFVFDTQGETLYCSDLLFLEYMSKSNFTEKVIGDSGYFDIEYNDSNYLTIYNKNAIGLLMYKIIPYHLISESLSEAKIIIISINILAFLTMIVISAIMISYNTKPLNRLAHHMEQIGSGNFNDEYKYKGNDEIKILSEQFDVLVFQIRQLISQQYIAALNMKTTQLKALEAQVNPHFLYNCLQSISTEAIDIGSTKIYQITEAMAYILRYSVGSGETVSILDEIKHVENFVFMQRVRFENRIQLDISIPVEMYGLFLPKLTFQVLVDNAIKYAINLSMDTIKISIEAKINKEYAEIYIIDNGPGIADQRLSQIHDMLKNDSIHKELDSTTLGIGLNNLKERIHLMFENKGDLEIKNGAIGVIVKLSIPIFNKEST